MQKAWEFCRPTMTVALFKPYPGTTAYAGKESINYSGLSSEFKRIFSYAETCNIKRLATNPVYIGKKLLKNIFNPKEILSLIKKGFQIWT